MPVCDPGDGSAGWQLFARQTEVEEVLEVGVVVSG
jgi:hypothetical protein